MINFWARIVNDSINKLSYRMYCLIKHMDDDNNCRFKSNWLTKIKTILNHCEYCGLSYIWNFQDNLDCTWLKSVIDSRLLEMDIQKGQPEIFNNSQSITCRMFKTNHNFEPYLTMLNTFDRISLCRFRCRNKLPCNINRFNYEPTTDRNCQFCEEDFIGDEFHFLFECGKFKSEKFKLIPQYYYKHPNTLKMSTF